MLRFGAFELIIAIRGRRPDSGDTKYTYSHRRISIHHVPVILASLPKAKLTISESIKEKCDKELGKYGMNTLLLSVLCGIAIGIVDILPMIRLRLPRYTIIASFIHFFTVTVVIFHSGIPHLPWWLKGGVLGFLLMLPMLIHVGHSDRKPLPIITLNAVVLGTMAGFLAHYLG